jgi:ribosome-associated translation inhibitor RaiA
MHIQIHADDFDLTEGLRDHVAKRLACVRFGRRSPNYIRSEIT